jgi:hypothetical protein
MAESNRLTRELETREESARPVRKWTPPQLLPEPEPEPGWAFRWIRLSILGTADPAHISSKLQEGWEPVKASTQPKLRILANPNGRFPDGIEIGGLLLCKTPVEMTEQRNAYYASQADSQLASVDNNFMRENNPKMPLFNERRSEVKFGRGS